MRDDDAYFLVSNRHILAGLTTDNRYQTGRDLPFSCKVLFPDNGDPTIAVTVDLPLLDRHRKALWWQHPRFGHRVDVVALPLPPLGVDLARVEDIGRVNLWRDGIRTVEPARPRPAQDVFVVGFPFGLNGGAEVLSIWTQATIATEPEIDLDSVPRFMIDGATREGLSGAPVYLRFASGSVVPVREGDTTLDFFPEDEFALIGIYSGRFSRTSDLGYVWKSHLIQEILDGRTPGTPLEDILGTN